MLRSQLSRLPPYKFPPIIGRNQNLKLNLRSLFLVKAISHSSRIYFDFTGAPGTWTEPILPVTLEKDVGLRYVDENASQYPDLPLEPLFRAIYTINPEYDPKQIDLVTDRNNLGKLVNVISGIRLNDFRIDIELVGNTLLFQRWERFNEDCVSSSDFKGFWKRFEQILTTYPADLRNSSSNHRIIQSTLGQITILLRFVGKAYLPESVATTSPNPIHNLNAAIQAIQLNTSGTNLRVLRGGVEVPHQALVELKSRAWKNPLNYEDPDFMFQLWIAQVENLKSGYYVRGGQFIKIEDKNFREEGQFGKFEEQNGQMLKKLVCLVENIREMVREHKSKLAVLLYEREVGEMQLYSYDAGTTIKHLLPFDLLSKWET